MEMRLSRVDLFEDSDIDLSVFETDKGAGYVSAYDLYLELGHTEKISDWFKKIISQRRIKEGRDFVIIENGRDLTKHKKVDVISGLIPHQINKNTKSQGSGHFLKISLKKTGKSVILRNVMFSVDAAKHICLQSNTEVGYNMREYLIKVDEEFKKMMRWGLKAYWKNKLQLFKDTHLNLLQENYAMKCDRHLAEDGLKYYGKENTKLETVQMEHYKKIIRYVPQRLDRVRAIANDLKFELGGRFVQELDEIVEKARLIR